MNAPIRPIFLVLMLCLSPTLTRAEEILVFAASSLATALDEIEQKFEAASDYEVSMVYAGSSTLARQIEQGAPADIFISANTDWMDRIAQAGLIAPDTQFDLLGNQLVLVAHGEGLDQSDQIISPEINLADLLDGGYLAMALVDAVPAGIYGNAALSHLDLWDTVVDRVAQFDNVRSALAKLQRGQPPLGWSIAAMLLSARRCISLAPSRQTVTTQSATLWPRLARRCNLRLRLFSPICAGITRR